MMDRRIFRIGLLWALTGLALWQLGPFSALVSGAIALWGTSRCLHPKENRPENGVPAILRRKYGRFTPLVQYGPLAALVVSAILFSSPQFNSPVTGRLALGCLGFFFLHALYLWAVVQIEKNR